MGPLSKTDSIEGRLFSLPSLPSPVDRLIIAFSGGIDSIVLLHHLITHREQYTIQLWHINHGLQQQAEEMEQFCLKQAENFGIPIRVDHLSLHAASRNVEAVARRQRYALFASELMPTDVLITAHHANDQAETLLLNLMRGSGPAGLRAIARQKTLGRSLLLRPMLNVTRQQVVDYAESHRLAWIEDPSNASTRFDRNFIRHRIMPVFEQRWPGAVRSIHRACDWQSESYQLMSELAQIDLFTVETHQPFTCYSSLSVAALASLSEARQRNVIRYWLKQQGKPVPGRTRLNSLVQQLNSRADACPRVAGQGYSIHLFRQQLYIVDLSPDSTLEPAPQPVYSFATQGQLAIAEIGLYCTREQILDCFNLTDQGQPLTLYLRQPGRPYAYSHRFKRLFQQHRIPPWLRDRIPLVVVDDEPVGLWLL